MADTPRLGIVLDSSVLVDAERANLTTPHALRAIRALIGELPIVVSAITVAELGHGIYRANTPERRQHRRLFLDELKSKIPVFPITAVTAEIVARLGGEQASRGVVLSLPDLLIAACAIETGYTVATKNLRDFQRMPGVDVLQV